MKWILNIKKEYKIPYILDNIFLIFFDSIGFIVPILIGFLCDSVTIHHKYNYLLPMTFIIAAFVIIKTLGSYLSVIKLDTITEKITSELKIICYENINKLDYYFFEHNNKGELITNFTSDINAIRRHMAYNIKTIGAIIITFTCSLIYLLYINTFFTIILLTPGIIIGIISFFFVKKIKPQYEIIRDKMSLANDFISDNIEANRVVKTFALEKSEIKRMKEKNLDYINKDMEIGIMENKFYGIVDFLSYFMNVIFLLLGGYFFIKGNITLGELVVFNSYLYNLRAPFIRLSGLFNNIQRYLIASKKIKKLLEAKPRVILKGTKHIDSLLVPIELQNVQIIYDDKIVVDNLNLKIKPYETIAFIGKTGSGKSTIANLLLGLITPSSGKVLINGEDYLNYDIKDIRYHIGYMAQQAFLFSDSIYNNIRYGNQDLDRDEAFKFASIACCDYIDKFPDGIDTIIGEKGVGLSGGEKQRLALARGLAVKPDILLLDDITSALDIETEEKINESIANLPHKSTKIIIAGKIVSVKNADHIYVIDKGKVVEDGTHKELLKKKGYYYELYNIQKGDI